MAFFLFWRGKVMTSKNSRTTTDWRPQKLSIGAGIKRELGSSFRKYFLKTVFFLEKFEKWPFFFSDAEKNFDLQKQSGAIVSWDQALEIIRYRNRRLTSVNQSHHRQEKKSWFFSSKLKTKHAFLNTKFLDSCHGAQTGTETPDSDQFLKSAIRTDVSTSEIRPSPDRKKKVFFFRVDPE